MESGEEAAARRVRRRAERKARREERQREELREMREAERRTVARVVREGRRREEAWKVEHLAALIEALEEDWVEFRHRVTVWVPHAHWEPARRFWKSERYHPMRVSEVVWDGGEGADHMVVRLETRPGRDLDEEALVGVLAPVFPRPTITAITAEPPAHA